MNTSQFTLVTRRVLSSHMWLVTATWPMRVCKMPPYPYPMLTFPLLMTPVHALDMTSLGFAPLRAGVVSYSS